VKLGPVVDEVLESRPSRAENCLQSRDPDRRKQNQRSAAQAFCGRERPRGPSSAIQDEEEGPRLGGKNKQV